MVTLLMRAHGKREEGEEGDEGEDGGVGVAAEGGGATGKTTDVLSSPFALFNIFVKIYSFT